MASSFWIGVLEEGLLYGIMVLGVYITYKILDFPDLSVDGSFPLGAAVTGLCLIKGVDPMLTVLLATGAGMLAGMITGILHVVLKITNLMSGILVMTGLYSINLRVMGKSNIALLGVETVFSKFGKLGFMSGALSPYNKVIVAILFAVALKLLMDWYLSTKAGFALKATGDNPQLITTLGVNIGIVKITGVMISNGLVALSGSLVAQSQSYSDVGMGVGIVVMGLASIIIGTSLFSKLSFVKLTTAALLGAIIYRAVIAASLKAELDANDLKLITAVLVIVFLGINNRGRFILDKIKKPSKESKA